jgi:hypothetical protein
VDEMIEREAVRQLAKLDLHVLIEAERILD